MDCGSHRESWVVHILEMFNGYRDLNLFIHERYFCVWTAKLDFDHRIYGRMNHM